MLPYDESLNLLTCTFPHVPFEDSGPLADELKKFVYYKGAHIVETF